MSRASERMPARVFISHTGADLDDARELAAVLDDLGYESQVDLAPGSFITKGVMEALVSADVVVALVGSGSLPPNVAFELGAAIGLGKPSLVVAHSDTVLPVDRAEILVVRADTTNRYALRLALERALSTDPHIVREDEPRQSRALGRVADGLLERARAASTEIQAVQILAEALAQSQVTASAEPGFQTPAPESRWHRPDLAAWVEETRQSLGNPVIFEVAADRSQDEVHKIRTYLEVAQARTGVAVWLDEPTPSPVVLWADEASRVLGASLTWLIEQMRDESIAAVLRRMAES